MPSLTALAIGGVSALGSVASGAIGASAAQSAAQTQAQAADQASSNTLKEFEQTQANLAPFVSGGQNALTALQGLIGTGPGGNPLTSPLTAPRSATFSPTMAQLQQTPGYQFSLNQGQMATQNGFAAQGLGTSGAAVKGAANYAEGLAGTTFQQQFQNYQTEFLNTLGQNQQIYNMLGGQAQLGENAGAISGQQGLQATGQAGNFLTSGAAASAAGQIGAANSVIGGISGATGGLSNAALLLSLNGSGLFGSGGGSGS